MILYSEGATKLQEDEANSILDTLSTAYPGHPWSVRVYDGGFFIKYLDPNLTGSYGMNCHYKNFGHSASAMKKEIIIMAGEWLERSGLKRGRNNEDEIVGVDGLPLKHQPKKAPIDLKPVGEPPKPRLVTENGNTLQ